VLHAVHVTPAGVREAAAALLADTGARQRAERLRDEIAALPDAAHAVTLLERLVSSGRPLPGA
jgi:UDP:flavonoid glycosyltransferase YjiC (YdhE family)